MSSVSSDSKTVFIYAS